MLRNTINGIIRPHVPTLDEIQRRRAELLSLPPPSQPQSPEPPFLNPAPPAEARQTPAPGPSVTPKLAKPPFTVSQVSPSAPLLLTPGPTPPPFSSSFSRSSATWPAADPGKSTAFSLRKPGAVQLGFWTEWKIPEMLPGAPCVNETLRLLQPYTGGRIYANYMPSSGPGAAKSVFGPNYERLVQIKKRYDPANFFHLNQNIDPG